MMKHLEYVWFTVGNQKLYIFSLDSENLDHWRPFYLFLNAEFINEFVSQMWCGFVNIWPNVTIFLHGLWLRLDDRLFNRDLIPRKDLSAISFFWLIAMQFNFINRRFSWTTEKKHEQVCNYMTEKIQCKWTYVLNLFFID